MCIRDSNKTNVPAVERQIEDQQGNRVVLRSSSSVSYTHLVAPLLVAGPQAEEADLPLCRSG